jgi:PPK2 family polyphosphate:nucleotide phosphotransferase
MIKLSDYPTSAPKSFDKDETDKKRRKIVAEIGKKVAILNAQKKHSLLIVFQGMDSSGKDGATKRVFAGCSQSHVNTKGFKKPTEEEFAHDFLWRIHKEAPRKGEVKIFIRSHYEDVLIQRVHGWISEEKAIKRIESINAFEELLQYDNNTTILKFYMHLSKERQYEKLTERIEDPERNYKHNSGDWEERKLWDKYMFCYEDAINRCSVPWIIAPVDQRWYRNYFIAEKVLEALNKMDLELPVLEEKPDFSDPSYKNI